MLILKDDWEFSVLGIYNYKKPGRFDAIISFIKENHESIPGDIIESGVYKGSSLIALAMLLKEVGSDKKVYGFDSFSGFPPIYHEKDRISEFERLVELGSIDNDHIVAVRKNIEYIEKLHSVSIVKKETGISSSGSFEETSVELLKKKIEIAELDNIILVEGPFSETMKKNVMPEKIMAAIIDCDLYQSYLDTFDFVWPRLSVNGMVHLDEYYSLKFPGARIATDEFVSKNNDAKLKKTENKVGDFERWTLLKTTI
ncbi:hypothetical protein JCM14469_19770 [Desulfatiferula olefinivorans]